MKTKQFLTTIVITLLFCTGTYAQMHRTPMRGPRPNHPNRAHAQERIHAIKVAYITDKLHFTSQQSASFWPIYDKYEQEVQETHRQFVEKYAKTNPGFADDNTSRQFIDDNLDYQQEVLNIRRKYNDEFLKVITPQQAAQLYKTEREFKQLLMQQLKEKRNEWNNGNNGNNGNNQDAPPADR
jgi:hypothetical protein